MARTRKSVMLTSMMDGGVVGSLAWMGAVAWRLGRVADAPTLLIAIGASVGCAARDLGVPIRAGARKARILLQTDPLPRERFSRPGEEFLFLTASVKAEPEPGRMVRPFFMPQPTLMNLRHSWVTAALLFLVMLTGSKLWAQGPPYQTDDPVPVDLHHYEFYIFGSADGTPVEMDSSGPAFEFNWGALPRVQVHAILPWGVVAPLNNPVYLPSGSGPTEFGLTDMELGVKIAFIKEGKHVPQIGSFTMFEMPTGNAAKGLGVGKVWYKLPIWLQKNIGAWTLDGGAGYQVVPQIGYRNFFYTGWLVKKKLNDRLELGAEVFAHGGEGSATPQTEASTLIDVGGYYHFKEHPGQQFLFCYGHSVAGQTENYAYVGMYWTWGKDKDDKPESSNGGYFPGQLDGSTF